MMAGKAALLIVNGGKDAPGGRWLELCLAKILEHTHWPDYHLYIWNNNLRDAFVIDLVSAIPDATLVQANPDEVLRHRHAIPLQRLFEIARKESPRYIVALDTDAHPIVDGWLTKLIDRLEEGAAVAGVWRDEEKEAIRPYVHASCLVTTTEFIRRNELRLDYIAAKHSVKHDTLSNFTDAAEALQLPLHKLKRANVNQLHRIIGGVYGNLIYHHGAGSRLGAQFWDERRSKQTNRENKRIRDRSSILLFNHYDRYMTWLCGRNRVDHLFILGMKHSGASCLAGALEQCGLRLGEASGHNQHNPAESGQSTRISRLNRNILSQNGGDWKNPPGTKSLVPEQQQEIRHLLESVSSVAPFGIKDPSVLLLLEHWIGMTNSRGIVGTFRHPLAVARSLLHRDGIDKESALDLWIHYNSKLIERHKSSNFPIVEFDLAHKKAYFQIIGCIAIDCGLYPNLQGISQMVSAGLDRAQHKMESVPRSCRATYEYLMDNRYKPEDAERDFYVIMLELSRPDTSWQGWRDELVETAALAAQFLPKSLTHRGRKLLNPVIQKFRSRKRF